jgi:hemerythrin-like metal-binding protein
MELFKWSNRYSVCIESIDEEHKGLFQLLNRLYTSLTEGDAQEILAEVIDELFEYTQKHFRREESLLKQVEYPYLKNHIALHEYFEQSIVRYREQLYSDPSSLTIDILSFLRDWLIQHIQGVDMDYVPYLKAKNLS